jgi:hypothetical protein
MRERELLLLLRRQADVRLPDDVAERALLLVLPGLEMSVVAEAPPPPKDPPVARTVDVVDKGPREFASLGTLAHVSGVFRPHGARGLSSFFARGGLKVEKCLESSNDFVGTTEHLFSSLAS